MAAVKSYKPCPRCAENFTARGKLCTRCSQRDRNAAKRSQSEDEMSKRKAATELPPMKSIAINTRKPDKWRFVDCETGEVWRWDTTAFDGHGTFKLVRTLNADAIAALLLR